MHMKMVLAGIVAATITSGSARAVDKQSFVARSSLSSLTSTVVQVSETPLLSVFQEAESPAESDEVVIAHTPEPFGTRNTWRLTLQAGGGHDLKISDNKIMLAGVGVSYFLIDHLSFNIELNAAYVNQIGRNSGGVDFNVLFRWHVFDFDTWTIYADAGAGMIFTLNDVPADGTPVNFTPQIGFGVSFEVSREAQLLMGVRWHHISNANTSRTNPGRDSIFAYAGVSLPF